MSQMQDAPFSIPAHERVLAGNACRHLSEADRASLARAARLYVSAHGLMPRTLGQLGRYAGGAIERAMGMIAPAIRQKIEETASDLLWSLLGAARLGLADTADSQARNRLYQGSVIASGAASGFFGGPALVAEIPFAMTLMFRAIAEIARDSGEDLSALETRRACLEVFGLGAIRDPEADVEASFWAVRAALTQAPIAVFLRTIAGRLSVTLSEQALAGAVPVIGALAGAGANYYFMRHFQTMADIHFTIRRIERDNPNPEPVRVCFDALVKAYRADQSLFRRAA